MRRSRINEKHPRTGRDVLMGGKCWICGADIDQSFQEADTMSGRFCRVHWLEHTRQHKKTVAEYLELKNRIMFERSMRTMERCDVDMTEYKRFAYAVRDHSAENPEQYKSSDEMVAAVILLKAGIDFEMNFKIGKYIVDIYIPDWNIIAEIDGDRHENRATYDSRRDVEIRRMLGEEWEIIRIPTKYIEQNPEKLPDGIKALADQKREIRRKNGGYLPENYSKREAARYKRAMVYDEIHARA